MMAVNDRAWPAVIVMRLEARLHRHAHGRYFFEDWSTPDPHDQALNEAMHTARYNLAALTQTQAYLILAAAEAYQHFAGHPARTEDILHQLRRVRRAVRKAPGIPAEE